MKLKFATNQVASYQVKTPVYEGPLDLLLQLIQNAELDITRVSLALVTDQYLDHMKDLENFAPDEVSAFMVIAAKLLQIKSEALLPRPPRNDEEEEDVGDELARQLLAYKRYKEIADLLATREEEGLHSYVRMAPPPRVSEKIDLGDFTVENLLHLAQKAFGEAEAREPLETVVTRPKVTIREQINKIATMLRENTRTSFNAILGPHFTRTEVVVSFLALLELIKRQYIQVSQQALFDDIELEMTAKWTGMSDEEFAQLEFGE
jgi:segregation and condensation protein A